MGIADRIQQGCLTVIDVTHHAYDRRSGDKLLLRFIVFFQQIGNQILLLFLFAENLIFQSNGFRFLIGELLVYRNHLSFQEKLLDDLGSLDLHLLSQFLDCNRFRKNDGADLLFFLHCDRFRFMESACPVRILLPAGRRCPSILLEAVEFLFLFIIAARIPVPVLIAALTGHGVSEAGLGSSLLALGKASLRTALAGGSPAVRTARALIAVSRSLPAVGTGTLGAVSAVGACALIAVPRSLPAVGTGTLVTVSRSLSAVGTGTLSTVP